VIDVEFECSGCGKRAPFAEMVTHDCRFDAAMKESLQARYGLAVYQVEWLLDRLGEALPDKPDKVKSITAWDLMEWARWKERGC
jgi:hypothetical protein